jgi:hypothetical protein
MTPRRLTFLTTSALVALAFATGTAQAMTADIDGSTTTSSGNAKVIPNDRGGRLGVGAVVTNAPIPDVFERAAQRAIAQQPVPDVFERAAQRGVTPVAGDVTYGYGPHGALLHRDHDTVPVATSTVASTDDGLDWQMVGYGGGALVLALGLIALGALALGGHRRTPAH